MISVSARIVLEDEVKKLLIEYDAVLASMERVIAKNNFEMMSYVSQFLFDELKELSARLSAAYENAYNEDKRIFNSIHGKGEYEKICPMETSLKNELNEILEGRKCDFS